MTVKSVQTGVGQTPKKPLIVAKPISQASMFGDDLLSSLMEAKKYDEKRNEKKINPKQKKTIKKDPKETTYSRKQSDGSKEV